MISKEVIKIALVGNPNTGKTSLFNRLTGLNQKVGNYPGITVDKKQGICYLSDNLEAQIIDLPGTYSINPTSADENIVFDTLVDDRNSDFPDLVIVVAEVENLKRNLFLFTQIKDLEIPTILVINMADQMLRKGITINIGQLESALNTKVVLVSARKKTGIDNLKKLLINYKMINTKTVADISKHIEGHFFDRINESLPHFSTYKSWLLITQKEDASFSKKEEQEKINFFRDKSDKIKKFQHKEVIFRHRIINEILKENYQINRSAGTDLRAKLDRILTHKIFGYLIFALILSLMFQSVFAWSETPMEWIDSLFSSLSEYTRNRLPKGKFTNLLVDGVLAGINGIVIFIPQIAILFLYVSVLEETGYMSRVVFIMDKIMRRFGMSGKSVIPIVSGVACAIPAIMSARNIDNWRERLITILVTPFTTCGARIPVYTILIALVIPNKTYFGVFNLQGITLLALYMLGFLAALISGYILHKVLKIKRNNFFVIELPEYKIPSIKNISITVMEKTKSFVLGAGKIILAISIIIWFLQTNGGKKFKNAEEVVLSQLSSLDISQDKKKHLISAYRSEHSYLGKLGKTIEPIVQPIGYDWKMGIGILTSFAAREVFVGTMATIYSVEDDGAQNIPLQERMRKEINPKTGEKIYNLASGLSLLIFYAFAMQCMSTLAIVKRETNSWKWPLLQLFGMSTLAYISALIVFQIFK
jgi:ferrous iron transport protein B